MYRLGILAGMGPRSTTPFLDAVLDECERQYGAEFDMDYPYMVVYSLPTPFYLDRPMVKYDMLEALEMGLSTLTRAECAVIAVPCNSVHAYYREMCAMTPVPILHIVDETIAQLTPQPGPVGLLATRATVEREVYQEQLAQHGKTPFWSAELQHQVDQLIHDAKQHGVTPAVVG